MDEKQELSKLQVEIDGYLHRQFKALTVHRGVTMKAAVEELLLLYAKDADTGEAAHTQIGNQPTTSPYAGREHWHDMLERILTRGTDRQQLGIQSNLEAFDANLVPHRQRKAG